MQDNKYLSRRKIIQGIGLGILTMGSATGAASAKSIGHKKKSGMPALKKRMEEKYGKKAALKAAPIIHSMTKKKEHNANMGDLEFTIQTLEKLKKHSETKIMVKDYIRVEEKMPNSREEVLAMEVE